MEVMSLTAVVVDSLVAVLLLASLARDRKKTASALRVAWNAIKRMGPSVLAIILVIGMIVGFVPPRWIASTIGSERGLLGLLAAAALGSVLFLPALVAFPLARSLLDMGAGVMSMAAFISTLTMIGFVFLPLEVRELDRRFALLRNGLSLVVAVLVSLVIGLVL